MAKSPEQGFRPIDQIPYPRLFDADAIALRLQHQLLEELGGISVRRGASKREDMITFHDLNSAPPDLTYQKFIDSATIQLGLDKSTFSEKDKLAALLWNINTALDAARQFETQSLGLIINAEATQAHVSSLKDLFDIIKGTSQFSKTKGLVGPERLNKQASFCSIVLDGHDALALQKKEFHELSADTEKIHKMIVSKTEEESGAFFHTVGIPSEEYMRVIPNTAVASPLKSSAPLGIRYRGKSLEAHMLKLGRKPEAQFNSREAVLDEVGMEVQFPRLRDKDTRVRDVQSIVQVMGELVTHVSQKNGATNIEIENANFLSKKDFREIIRLLGRKNMRLNQEYSFAKETKEWLDSKEGAGRGRANQTSAAKFESLKFTYTVEVPTFGGGTRERNVEIQFSDEVSSAHDLHADHRIYKVVQYVNFMTRRFGGCSEQWILWKIGNALNEPGPRLDFTPEQVLKFLTNPDSGRLVSLPGIAKRNVYADPSVYKRELGARLYDETKVEKEVNLLAHAARGRKRE